MKRIILLILLSVFLKGYTQSPGNIDLADVELWIKANTGVTGTNPITTWVDQSSTISPHTLTVTGSGPTLVADLINFNPAVDFDGVDDSMVIVDGIMGTNTFNDLTVYIVTKVDEIRQNFAFYEPQSDGERFATHLPWSDTNLYYDVGKCCNSSRVTQPWGESTGLFYLWTLSTSTSTATLTGTRKSIYKDGEVVVTNNKNDGITGNDSDFILGGQSDSFRLMDGAIAEMIVFSDIPTASEQLRIHTYLAIKYGITLDNDNTGNPITGTNGDYLLSDGTTIVWDGIDKAAYHHDILAIARDDDSDLEQLKSKSINAGTVLTIEKTGMFAADLDAVIIGNNGESNTTTTTGAHPSFSERLERIWSAEVNGAPGVVSISFQLGGSVINTGDATNYALLRDTDTDFSDGTPVTTDVVLSGNILTFSNVMLADGDLFTLGTSSSTPYPGGVDNNFKLWYRADDGVETTGTNVSTWEDFSGAGFSFGTSTGLPQQNSSGINYNNSIDFDGDDNLQTVNNLDIRTMFITYNHIDGGSFETPFTNESDLFFGDDNGNVYNTTNTSSLATGGTSYVNGVLTDLLSHNVPENTEVQTRVLTSNESTDETYYIGSNQSISGRFYTGKIGEFIIYDDVLTDEERDKVESYLAIKYGVTLDNTGGSTNGDYILSDGTVIWDASLNIDYHSNIAIIGLDENSGLSQKQSKSENDNSILTVSLGSTVEGTNTDNTNTFTNDLDFLALGIKTTGTNFAVECGEVIQKVNRDWKVQNTNFSQTVTLQFDMDGILIPEDFDLLIDTDGDFDTTGDQTTETTGVLSGTNLTFSGITLNNGTIFTLIRKAGYDITYNGSWSGGSDPTTADSSKRVIIEADVNITGNFDCNCLKVDSGMTLTVEDSQFIEVDELILNGDIYLEGDAELIQTTVNTHTNSGSGQVYKIINDVTESEYSYSYLTSPVNALGAYSLSGNLKINNGGLDLRDNIDPTYTNNYNGSGAEISRYWLYTLNSSGTYTKITESTSLNAGVGYTMKGTNQVNDYNFIGTPNNGNITALNLATGEYAIVGNPYPSAIDADVFNTSMLANNVTNGAIYFWDQSTGSSHVQTQYDGGYSTRINGVGAPASGVVGATTPTNIIKPGQGFVVAGGTVGGDVIFANSMRISNTSSSSSAFFKTSKVSTNSKPIIRLGFEFENEEGTYHRQIVTTPNGGTLEYDDGEDAIMFENYPNDAYWVVNKEDSRYVITNVPNINNDLELPIGVVLDSEKEVTFKLDGVENLSESIYIMDNETEVITKLSDGNGYKTTLSTGEYTNRFSLLFKESETLNTILPKSLTIETYVKDGQLYIVSEKDNIKDVVLYDMLGNKIPLKINSNGVITISSLTSQIYIVKIRTTDGVFTKKILKE